MLKRNIKFNFNLSRLFSLTTGRSFAIKNTLTLDEVDRIRHQRQQVANEDEALSESGVNLGPGSAFENANLRQGGAQERSYGQSEKNVRHTNEWNYTRQSRYGYGDLEVEEVSETQQEKKAYGQKEERSGNEPELERDVNC